MIDKVKYGVVYTPNNLAKFVARVLLDETGLDNKEIIALDPACGEGALLNALKDIMDRQVKYIGIDVDDEIIKINKRAFGNDFSFLNYDTILPIKRKNASEYWKMKLGGVSLIIANPPWSVERLYEKNELKNAGYTLIDGQYDNYVLFIELCIEILEEGGLGAFLIPDSLFYSENRKLRKLLCEKTCIKVIARLGEKLFEGVNRSTSLLIFEKRRPGGGEVTKCFRLSTIDRKKFLTEEYSLYDCYKKEVHEVRQSRFTLAKDYIFDIDARTEDEKLLEKIESHKINWNDIFTFSRGVEISKSGEVVICPNCKNAQGFSKKQYNSGEKACIKCKNIIKIENENVTQIISENKLNGFEKILVGENLQRYYICGRRYIKLNVLGINYKNPDVYLAPKLLIRKTGLGVNAFLDKDSTLISQTVYSCRYIDNNNKVPLEYYLAIINSRVIYYYYLKKFGENEWKSHPYLTKEIIFSLPIKEYKRNEITKKIIELVKELLLCYNREVDLKLENNIMDYYELSEDEKIIIKKAMNSLPNLGAINNMKFQEEICLDI